MKAPRKWIARHYRREIRWWRWIWNAGARLNTGVHGFMDEKTLREIEDVGHIGMWGDERRIKANEAAGHPLCEHCGGSGNELYFMYRKCPECNGTGIAKPRSAEGAESGR